jgi:hypothetical protein
MTQYKHIVQVHPVELGEPNLHKVKREEEFEHLWQAEKCVEWLNMDYEAHKKELKAVYLGCVNCETGELV